MLCWVCIFPNNVSTCVPACASSIWCFYAACDLWHLTGVHMYTCVHMPHTHTHMYAPPCECVCLPVCLYLPLTPTRTKVRGWLKKKTPLLASKNRKTTQIVCKLCVAFRKPSEIPIANLHLCFPTHFPPTHTHAHTGKHTKTATTQTQQQKSDHENASEKFAKINEQKQRFIIITNNRAKTSEIRGWNSLCCSAHRRIKKRAETPQFNPSSD